MDQELENLFKRIFKTIIIIIVFILIVSLAFIKKFNSDESKPLKKIKKEDNITLLLRKTKCENCNEIKRELNNQSINYIEIKTDTEKYYDSILKELEITTIDIVEPSIVTIKDGSVFSILVDIKNINELEEYLKNNK